MHIVFDVQQPPRVSVVCYSISSLTDEHHMRLFEYDVRQDTTTIDGCKVKITNETQLTLREIDEFFFAVVKQQ